MILPDVKTLILISVLLVGIIFMLIDGFKRERKLLKQQIASLSKKNTELSTQNWELQNQNNMLKRNNKE